MPERLTDSLIRRGHLTKRRADEASKRQVLMGGALDTSLLELGHVAEDTLVEGMAAAYGLATASPRHARAERDHHALRMFPEQWAQKHMLAPLGYDQANNTLSVLSPAPADVNLIVRLGDLLDLTIRPLLAPEFRVQERIAFLYDREPPERFKALIAAQPTPESAVTTAPVVEPKPPITIAPPPKVEAPGALSFGEAVSRLRDAKDRDDIVRVTLLYAIRDLEHASVFINHEDRLEGWLGYGPGSENVPRLHVELGPESAFSVVLETRAHYLGPLPNDAGHGEFLKRLGRAHPRAVLIVPIRIQSRTVAVLYGENGAAPIAPRIAADLMLFTTHVQMALSDLLLRRKAESLSELTQNEDAVAKPEPEPESQASTEARERIDSFGHDDSADTFPPGSDPLTGNWAMADPTAHRTNPPVIEEPLVEPPYEDEDEDDDPIEVVEDVEPTIPVRIPSHIPSGNGATSPRAEPAPIEARLLETDDIEIDEADPIELGPDVPIEDPVDLPPPSISQSVSGWEPVDMDGLDDLGNELDETIAAAQAAMNPESDPLVHPPGNHDPFAGGVLFQTGDLDAPLLAETQDGINLLDELDELEDQLTSSPPGPSASEPEDPDGWESVAVDNTWDADAEPNHVASIRSSIIEDSTVPDLSAEAWIRASSETTRARPLPPEVMERAAMPEAREPVPLTRITIGQRATPPVIEINELDDDRTPPGDNEEPVPLTQLVSDRSSGIDPTLPMMLDEEPVPLTKRSTSQVYAATPVSSAIPETPSPFAFDEDVDAPDFTSDAVVDAMGRLIPSAPMPPPATVRDPTTVLTSSYEQQINQHLEALSSEDEAKRSEAIEALMKAGPTALDRMSDRFPGPLWVDPFAPDATNLPQFAKCGPLLSILERHGRDAHPFVSRRLDAPDPLARFFAIYFYAAVFVPDAIPRLIQRLHDEESRICMLGARTLFSYREHPDFALVLDHLHGRLVATSVTARRHATYLIGLFRDVTAIPRLIEVVEQKEKSMVDVVEDALAEITKQRFGGSGKKWRAWWNKNQDKNRIEWLIDGLAAKDVVLRRSAAEELRAVTGLDMGFDENGPKRQRDDAKQRWHKWWLEAESAS